jgi:hypothetical protein
VRVVTVGSAKVVPTIGEEMFPMVGFGLGVQTSMGGCFGLRSDHDESVLVWNSQKKLPELLEEAGIPFVQTGKEFTTTVPGCRETVIKSGERLSWSFPMPTLTSGHPKFAFLPQPRFARIGEGRRQYYLIKLLGALVGTQEAIVCLEFGQFSSSYKNLCYKFELKGVVAIGPKEHLFWQFELPPEESFDSLLKRIKLY